MRNRISIGVIAMWVAATSVALAATSVEKIRNKQVLVMEETLAPGESEGKFESLPSMIVYMSSGVLEGKGGAPKVAVHPGETVFQAAPAVLKNVGSAALHFVRVGFLTAGSHETWGTTGLSPHYVLLLENQYGQPSTLKTGEVVWRLGGTHIGHNLGHTDLWVIAVEPK
jgi:hypothetical protein